MKTLVQNQFLTHNNINKSSITQSLLRLGLLLFLLPLAMMMWAHGGPHYGRANVAVATGSTGSGTVYIGTPGTTSATWDCGDSSNGDSKSFTCTCTGWADGYYFAGWDKNATTVSSYTSTSASASLSFGSASSTTSSSPTNLYYYAWILGVKPTAAAGDVSFNVDNLSTTLTKTVSFTQTGGDAQADFNNATITLKSGGGTWTHTSTTYNGSTKKVDVVFTYKSGRSTWTNAAGTRTDKATLTLSSKGNESFSTEITASLPNVSISAGSGGSITRSNATATETGSVTFPVTYVDNKDDLNTPTIAKTSGEGTWAITGYSYSANTVTVNYSHTGDGTYGSRASAATITLSAKAGGATNTCNVTATYPAIAVTGGDDTGAYPLGTEDALGTATFFVSHADALTDFTIPTAVTDITGGTWTVNDGSAVYTQSTSDPTTGAVTIDYTYNAGDIIGVKTAKLTLTSSNGSSYALTLTGERAAAAEQDVSVTTAGGVTTKYDTWAAGLAAANAADGCTLKLLRDVSGLTASQEVKKTMTLDLNHFTLSGTLSAAGGLLKLNTAGKVLTITDGKSDGAISVSGDVNGRISTVEILKGALVLNKGDLTATNANTGATQANIYVATVYLAASTNMTMTAGNITARRTGASGNYCHGIYCAGTGASASSVNLTGGTITSDFANGGYAIGVYAAGTSIIKDMTISGSAKTCAYAIWAQDGKLAVNGGTLSGTTSTSTARALYTKTNPATKGAVVVNNAILNATAGTTDAKGVYCQSTSATISGDPTDANIILSNVTVDAKTTGTTNAYAIFTDAGVCLLVNSGDFSATAQTTDAYAIQTSGYTAIVNGTFNATATNKIARAINVLAGITAVRNGSFNATATTEKAHTTYVENGAKLLTYGGTFHGKLLAATAKQYATGSYIASGGTLEAQGGTFWGEIAKEGLGAAQTNYAIGVYAPAGATISIQNATLKAQTDNTYVNGAYALNIATANAASLTNCTLQATSAYQHGYAIYNNGTPLSVKNCTATVNTTYAYNYGIYNNAAASVTTTENSSFTGTSGTTYAYGGYVNNGTLTAIDCAFSAETKRTGATEASDCYLYGIFVNKGKSATLNGCTITATGSGAYSNNGYGVYVDGSADIEDCTVTVSSINSGAYAIWNTGNTTAINVASGKFKAAATSGTIVETNATAAATKQKLYGGYYVHNTNLEKYLPEGYGIETLPNTSTEYKEGYRYAIRATTNIDPVCKIGATPYSTLEEALEFVNKNSGTSYTILMVKDYTLPAGDYTLPAKATLLVPYSADQTAAKTTNLERVKGTAEPSQYRKLTFANSAKMNVYGTIETSSRQTYQNSSALTGQVYGAYGYIYMTEGSNLTLESGSKVFAWGYISGLGEIYAKSGSKVYEMFQIGGYKGGNTTSTANSNKSDKVFPISDYAYQNIECPITYYPGMTAYGYGAVEATSYTGLTKVDNVELVGTGTSSFFRMTSEEASADTWVKKIYNPSNDYTNWVMNNGATLSGITLSVGATISSNDFYLPISNNFIITLNYGDVNIKGDVIFMPGAKMVINKEAKCIIASGKYLFLYDNEDWFMGLGSTSVTASGWSKAKTSRAYYYPATYSPSWTKKTTNPRLAVYAQTKAKLNAGVPPLPDAEIFVHGQLEINGYFYTTGDGISAPGTADRNANTYSTDEDAGKIKYNQAVPTSSKTIKKICFAIGQTEANGGWSNMTYGGTTTAYSAYLKNGDGTYEHTAGTAAGKTWMYYNNKWNCWEERGCFTYDAQDHPYAKPAAYVQLTSDTEDANHLYRDAATGIRRFLVDNNCIWWEVEPTPYDGNKYKCVTPDHNGKYKYYEYVSGWQEATVTVTWSINGSNTNYTVLYGTHPKYLSASPSKTATASEYYTWTGWTQGSTEGAFYAKDAELPVVTSDTTYYAYFETHKYSYTVQFKNYDGAVLQATRWEADQTPYYMGDTDPVKPATTALVYTFTGWSPAFTPVTTSGNKTYTAQFDAGTARKYTIQWVNYNGTVLKEEEVAYGTIPTAPATPTRPNDAFYTYTFNSWSPAITSVSGNQTYTATYDYSQKVTKYDIIFKNGTETIYSQSLPNGETPVYGGATPTKDETAQYTYTFDGWSATDGGTKITGSLPVVSGAAKTYYAVYTHVVRKYTIRWKSEDGKVLYETDTNVPYGTTPTFDGATPTKPRKGATVYTFDGWSSTIGGAKIALPSVSGNATYYAHFSDLPVYTLTFNANGHGTAPATQEVVSGQKAIEPTAPTAEGYLFGGWYKEAACTTPWNFASDVVTSNRSVFAKWTEAVASVTLNDVTTYYASVAGAIAFANDKTNPTVKMLKNASVASEITISASMTIDLNGKTVSSTLATATGVFNINASGKTVTIRDSQTGGKIDHTASFSGKLYGINLTAGTLNIGSGTIYAKNNVSSTNTEYRAVGVNGAASTVITMSDGTIEATSPNNPAPFGIYTSGNLTMTGGTITSSGTGTTRGIYVKGTTTLSNAAITATATGANCYAIFAKAGTLTINSGTYTATGTSASYAIHEEAGTVNIKGGRFSSATKELNKIGGTASIQGGYYVHSTDLETNCATNYHVLPLTGEDPYKYEVAEAYTVTFKANGHGTAPATQTIKKGGKATEPDAPTADGYTFGGWFKEETCTNQWNFANDVVSGATVLYAKWTIKKYSLTVNVNDASYGTVSQATITDVPHGSKVTTNGSQFTVNGITVTATPAAATAQYTYTFNHWNNVPATVTGNVANIEAVFTRTINQYDVTFDMKEHGSAISKQTKDYGSKVDKPADPSEAGYTFVGWYKEDACTNAWNFASDEVTGATTLYAKWTVNSYTITFDTDGGSAVASITQDYSSTVTPPANPTKEGYTFNGWLPVVPATMPIDGATCVAQWTVNNYTITYDLAGGSATNPTSYTIETATFTLTNPTREGYTFAGWTGTDLDAATTTISIAQGSTGNRSYTATWTINQYTIRFIDGDGNVLTNLDAADNKWNYGTTPTYSGDTPTKANSATESFTFNGTWSPAITTVSGDQDYVANFDASPLDQGAYMDIIDWNDTTVTLNMHGYVGSGSARSGWEVSANDGTNTTSTYEFEDCRSNKNVLTLDIRDLSATPNGTIYIKGLSSTGALDSYHSYRVPVVCNASANLSGTTAESIVLVRQGTLTVTSNTTVKALYVYPGAELVINSGVELTVTDKVVLRTIGNTDAAQLANFNGGVSARLTNNGTLACDNVYYTRISTENTKALQIGFPFDVDLTKVVTSSPSLNARYTVAGQKPYGTLFGILRYDAASRAENGIGGNWKGLDPTKEKTLSANTGYQILAASDFYYEFYFPVEYSRTDAGRSISVLANKSDSTNVLDQGWNYVTSPYTQPFVIRPSDSPEYNFKMTELVLSDGMSGDEVFVQYEPTDEKPLTLKPASPFYLQVASAGSYTINSDGTSFNAGNAGPNGAPARKPQASVQTQWIKLYYGNIDAEDQTTIYLNNKFSTDYETGFDVVKYSKTSSIPTVYSSLACGDLAFAALPDSVASRERIPLTVFAPRAAEMYFSMAGNAFMDRLESVLLIDTYDGTTTDLLFGDYYYYAEQGTQKGRFYLQPVFRAPKVATDVDAQDESGALIHTDGNSITVSGLTDDAKVLCYDVVGHLIAQYHTAGQTVTLHVPATGVYFIQVGKQVTKVVIR